MNKNKLAKWCGNYCNCYYYLYNGDLFNTGPCPYACDGISEDIMNSVSIEDVTSDAASINRQMQYEVEHNNCKLFKVMKRTGSELIICYFGD